MALKTHGDVKYQTSTLLARAAEWNTLRVEHRQIGPGMQNVVRTECTELVYILSGQSKVRRTADGQTQEAMALPGTSWLVPAGTNETLLELDGTTECLIIFLPPKLLEDSALQTYDIDPDNVRLAYAGGFADPTLAQIGKSLHGMLGRKVEPVDAMFADGLRTALAAHLVGNYSADRWHQPSLREPSLDGKRLRRVLDLIDARLGDPITLDDLAREACLSPFHFSRLFKRSTGLTPHRYLMDRRIQAAKAMLSSGKSSIAEIAFDSGFGSQASFARTFRSVAGLTPGQYRDLHVA